MNTINYEKLIDDLNKLLIEVDEKCDRARKRDKRQAEALRNEIKTYVSFEIARLKNELEYAREPRPQIPPLLPIFPDIHFSGGMNPVEPPKTFSSQEQHQQLTETQSVPVPVPKRKEEVANIQPKEQEEGGKISNSLNDNDKEIKNEKDIDGRNKSEEDGIIYPSTVASFNRLQVIEEERKETENEEDDFLSLDANNENKEENENDDDDDDFLSLDKEDKASKEEREETENDEDDDFLSLDKEERKETENDENDFLSLDAKNNDNNENTSNNTRNEEENDDDDFLSLGKEERKENENDDDDNFLSLSDDDDDFLNISDDKIDADKPTGQIDFVGDAYKEMKIVNKEVIVPIEDSKGNSNKLKIRLSEHTEEVVRGFLKKYGPTKKYVDDLKGKLTPNESSERGITLPFEVGGKTVSLTTSHESVEEDLKKFFGEDNIPDDIVGTIVEFVDAQKEKAFK